MFITIIFCRYIPHSCHATISIGGLGERPRESGAHFKKAQLSSSLNRICERETVVNGIFIDFHQSSLSLSTHL